MKKILFLESFYGGSHKAFADGFIKHSRHEITLMTLPARFWKWRMRGASLWFAEKVKNPEEFDLIFATDLLSVSDLKSLWGKKCPPVFLYFHENQLCYPESGQGRADYQYGFTDITSAFIADRIVFNSHFHRDGFLEAIPRFFKMMPDNRPSWITERIREKSSVLYLGCDYPVRTQGVEKNNSLPHILWNHRWEHDKNPELFFDVLKQLKAEGHEFRLIVVGENFTKAPPCFKEAQEHFKKEITDWGYAETLHEYHCCLEKADIVISTSNQENFGISVMEAVNYGARALLPNRLSYPELMKDYRDLCIYKNDDELLSSLRELLTCDYKDIHIPELYKITLDYSWENIISYYDDILEETAEADYE